MVRCTLISLVLVLAAYSRSAETLRRVREADEIPLYEPHLVPQLAVKQSEPTQLCSSCLIIVVGRSPKRTEANPTLFPMCIKYSDD